MVNHVIQYGSVQASDLVSLGLIYNLDLVIKKTIIMSESNIIWNEDKKNVGILFLLSHY
jgi:hypothetical protein